MRIDRHYKSLLETNVNELSTQLKRGLEQCLAKLRETEAALKVERHRRAELEAQLSDLQSAFE